MLLEAVNPGIHFFDDFWEIIIFIVGLFMQSFLGWLKRRKPVKTQEANMAALIKSNKEMKAEVTAMKSDVSYCKAELTYNGGHTTKDMTLSNKNHIEQVKEQVLDLRAQQVVTMEQLYNSSEDAILIFDVDGKCTFANEKAQALLGMSLDALCDEWISVVYSQSEREKILQSWKIAIKEGMSFNRDFPIKPRGTKEVKRVSISAKPLRDERGKFMYYFSKIRIKTIQ